MTSGSDRNGPGGDPRAAGGRAGSGRRDRQADGHRDGESRADGRGAGGRGAGGRGAGGQRGATAGALRGGSAGGRGTGAQRGGSAAAGRTGAEAVRGPAGKGRPGGAEVAVVTRRGGELSRSTLWSDEDVRPEPQPLRASWEPVPPPSPPGTAGRRRGSRPQRRRSAIGWFVHHYGWRAYALPVLVALTVVAVVQLVGSNGAGAAATDGAASGGAPATGPAVTVTVGTSVPTTVTVEKPGPTTTVSTPAVQSPRTGQSLPDLGAADPNGTYQGIAAGALPPGAPFAKTGAGTFHVVDGKVTTIGDGPDHRSFTIEVEDGIQNAAKDELFADAVMSVLSDSRSWIGSGKFTLKRIVHGTPDFRVSLTSQMTVREPQNCGWQIKLEASCYNRLDKRVFINDARWVRGAVSYNGDLGSYRVYAINHEVGHALGYHHEPCPKNDGLAPVMMQQSWSTADDDLAKLAPDGPVRADDKVCKYNPFPFPRGPDDAAASGGASAGG